MSLPEPGWYADPTGEPVLRLWDGATWTSRTRAVDLAPPAGSLRPRRVRRAASMVVLAGVLAFAVRTAQGGMRPVLASAATPVDCSLPMSRPTPAALVAWLIKHGVPAHEAALTTPPPADTCGAAAFTFGASPKVNYVFTYPSYALAAQAVHSPATKAHQAFYASVYLIALDRSLSKEQPGLKAVMRQYVAFSDPLIPPVTLMARS
jgi:hypothetical protein